MVLQIGFGNLVGNGAVVVHEMCVIQRGYPENCSGFILVVNVVKIFCRKKGFSTVVIRKSTTEKIAVLYPAPLSPHSATHLRSLKPFSISCIRLARGTTPLGLRSYGIIGAACL